MNYVDLKPVFKTLCIDQGAKLREKFKDKWITRKKTITYRDLASHLSGNRIIGHVCQGFVDVISRDIDAHGLLPGMAEDILRETYHLLCCAHSQPSMVVRTRTGGGLHCYWFLEEKVPYETLRVRLMEMVPGVEVLPIARHDGNSGKIIRSPFCYKAGGHGLDPETLLPLPIKTRDLENTTAAILDAATHKVTLQRFLGLSQEMARAIFKNSAKKSQKLRRGLKVSSSLLEITRDIRQGNTNNSILAMVRACRISQFNCLDTIDFISRALQSAPITIKKDTQGNTLNKRIKWLYGKCKVQDRQRATATLKPQPTLFTNDIATAIVERVCREFPGITGRRLGTLKKFCYSLVNSVEKVRELSTKERRLIDAVYKGFYHRTVTLKQIPLPYTLFRSWTQKVSWYVERLRKIGVLIPTWEGAHGGYCPGGHGDHYRSKEWGKCRFWQVELLNNLHTCIT